MAWFYEIVGKNHEVLEKSEPIYATQFDAQNGWIRAHEREAEPLRSGADDRRQGGAGYAALR